MYGIFPFLVTVPGCKYPLVSYCLWMFGDGLPDVCIQPRGCLALHSLLKSVS